MYKTRRHTTLRTVRSMTSLYLTTDAAIEYQRKMDSDARDKAMRYMVKHMGRFLMELSRCVR